MASGCVAGVARYFLFGRDWLVAMGKDSSLAHPLSHRLAAAATHHPEIRPAVEQLEKAGMPECSLR